MAEITIISDVSPDAGWAPIVHMQRLLSICLGADIFDISLYPDHYIHSLASMLRKRDRSVGERIGIFITPNVHTARKFVPVARKLGGFSRTAIWMIDSFWTDAVPRHAQLIAKHFDHVVHMQGYDDAFYRGLFGDRSLRLEWGSDVLGLGSDNPERRYDLLRVGRQPEQWDNDAETAALCKTMGLRFCGRPPFVRPAEALTHSLSGHFYSQSKFVLAHSNVAAPAPYTHPTKAYVTARWTDAVASGAVVAGRPPEGDLTVFDWPEALLVLPSLDRQEGLEIIADASKTWTPDIARTNYRHALRKLDWRWRFETLARAMRIEAPVLAEEFGKLRSRIDAVT